MNLALKYRPQVFSDLIGQEVVSRTLLNAVKSGKIAHSYIFYGPRGSGKTSTARILAKTLNCHSPKDYNPCNECVSCKEISSSSSLDVIEIDAASYTKVENVRETIIENVNLSPVRDRYKIYILDEVHMLSTSAFNALLKTIEEPPEHVVFIMATTEINKVPLTIISRCHTFKFKPIPPKLMVERLKEICQNENIKYDEEGLNLIVNFANGALRDSLTLLEKVSAFSKNTVTSQTVRDLLGYPSSDLIKDIAEAILKRDVLKINELFDKVDEEGMDVIMILKELRDYFSKCFLHLNGIIKLDYVVEVANPFIYPKLARKINRIIEEIKFSDNLSLIARTFIFTIIDTSIDIDEIAKKIEKMAISTQSIEKNAQKKTENTILEEESDKKEDKDSENSWAVKWRKILTAISREKIALYNVLLSGEVKLEGDTINIAVSKEFDRDMIENNKKFLEETIRLVLQKDYKVVCGLKKSSKQISKTQENFVAKDIEDEISFPELEKIKKVFGSDITKINIKDETNRKTN